MEVNRFRCALRRVQSALCIVQHLNCSFLPAPAPLQRVFKRYNAKSSEIERNWYFDQILPPLLDEQGWKMQSLWAGQGRNKCNSINLHIFDCQHFWPTTTNDESILQKRQQHIKGRISTFYVQILAKKLERDFQTNRLNHHPPCYIAFFNAECLKRRAMVF